MRELSAHTSWISGGVELTTHYNQVWREFAIHRRSYQTGSQFLRGNLGSPSPAGQICGFLCRQTSQSPRGSPPHWPGLLPALFTAMRSSYKSSRRKNDFEPQIPRIHSNTRGSNCLANPWEFPVSLPLPRLIVYFSGRFLVPSGNKKLSMTRRLSPALFPFHVPHPLPFPLTHESPFSKSRIRIPSPSPGFDSTRESEAVGEDR